MADVPSLQEAEGYTLHIGNKRYSSWSLRGWLLIHAFGLQAEERLTPLYSEAFEKLPDLIAPGRQVPTLVIVENGVRQVVWDSLAIAETLAERHPDAGHWPRDPIARARARCLAAEMHSGFGALRREMPMNLADSLPGRGRGPGVAADVARVDRLWSETRAQFGVDGPWLFGAQYSAADAFFAPVATRFETYGVALSDAAAAYRDALLSHPPFLRWREAADAEPWIEPRYQFGVL